MQSRHGTQLFPPITATDHSLGPEHAPITLVEYGDYECPTCKQALGAVKIVLAHFETRVRFVFRHFPLEQAHPNALNAALAAECAGGQGKFWQMHDVLFEHQGHLERRQLFEYARTLDLDMARFTAEMDDEIYLQRIREHQRSGQLSGVRATPSFFVNGRIQDVSYGMRSLVDALNASHIYV